MSDKAEKHHGGDLIARDHSEDYIKSLTSIGGSADFRGSSVTELPQLTSIGWSGYLDG